MTDFIYRDHNFIKIWLTACLLLIALMVAVGGYTRLSGSGLSITQWKPIHGIIPPMNDGEWEEEFTTYKQSPQYQKVNSGMEMQEFQIIFWPEYWHRVLGRIIGMVFFIPLLIFALRKSISRRFGLRLAAIFALGGLQGLVGWLMVASGLVNNPFVSHIRLALHLSLAFLLFALILWAFLDVVARKNNDLVTGHRSLATYLFWFTILCLQIILGALVAGLKAGLIYNTWPMMDGMWLPPEIFDDPKPWHQNEALIQFLHRTIAVLVVLGFGAWWYRWRHEISGQLKKPCMAVAVIIVAQFMLGVLALINQILLPLALCHQITGLLLFGSAVWLLYDVRRYD